MGLISFKLPDPLETWLTEEAARRDMSRSAFIRVILQRAKDRSK